MKVVTVVGNGFDIAAGLRTDAKTIVSEYRAAVSLVKDPLPGVSALAEAIDQEGIERWCDFELKLGQFAANEGVCSNVDSYLDAKASFDEVLRELLLLRKQAISDSFVQQNATKCIESLASVATGHELAERRRLGELLGQAHNDGPFEHVVMSLNYTPLLERLCEYRLRAGSIIANGPRHSLIEYLYMHETLEGCPICGVNDTGQISNTAFCDDSRVLSTVVKPRMQEVVGTIPVTSISSYLSSANIICVYGSSYGETDYRWWKVIADSLLSKKSSALVLYDHSYPPEIHVPLDKITLAEKAKERFLDAARLNDSRQRSMVKDRIIVHSTKGFLTIGRPLSFKGASEGDLKAIVGKCSHLERSVR